MYVANHVAWLNHKSKFDSITYTHIYIYNTFIHVCVIFLANYISEKYEKIQLRLLACSHKYCENSFAEKF